MTKLSVRVVQSHDRDTLWSMLKPVFRAGETYAIDPGISEVDALSYWTGADAGAFVIEDAGCALGTYYIRTNQPGGGSHVCNCGFITAQGTAGKGVARAMLEDALVRAKTAGFTAMQFNFVLANNTRAIDIWTRAGFDTVGRLPGAFDHPKDGLIDALVMYRQL